MNQRTTLALLVFVAGVLLGGWLIAFGAGSMGGANDDVCKPNAPVHSVHIVAGKASAIDVQAKRCDRLMITNEDEITRELAFGQHENHTVYDGISEKVLNKGGSLSVTLNRPGRFHWHDHLHDETEGYFTVSN